MSFGMILIYVFPAAEVFSKISVNICININLFFEDVMFIVGLEIIYIGMILSNFLEHAFTIAI